ncbi:T-cell receptor delta chain C region [Merluccius polli]|nr:T-cell receptor delta chain C region [Merluccius polli]
MKGKEAPVLWSPAAADKLIFRLLIQSSEVWTREPEVRPENQRLTVGSADKHTPSYYKLLSPNGSVACLASDFNSGTNQTDVFTGASEASRAPGEAFYSQVAISTDLTCPEDEKVNSLSLIMLGLRILFLKAVAFNVLLTLRLFSGLQRHLTDSTEDNFPPRLVFLDCNGVPCFYVSECVKIGNSRGRAVYGARELCEHVNLGSCLIPPVPFATLVSEVGSER